MTNWLTRVLERALARRKAVERELDRAQTVASDASEAVARARAVKKLRPAAIELRRLEGAAKR